MATLVFKMLDNKKPLPVYLQHSFTYKNILFTFKHTYKQMSYFTFNTYICNYYFKRKYTIQGSSWEQQILKMQEPNFRIILQMNIGISVSVTLVKNFPFPPALFSWLNCVTILYCLSYFRSTSISCYGQSVCFILHACMYFVYV